MQDKYNHEKIQSKWKKIWFDQNIYAAHDFSQKKKKFILVEFPYPSGTKLHMGHVMRYTIPEIYSRKLRMDGYNVMFPMGWDAFGLPAENYAVKTGVHPAQTTEQAINTFRELFQNAGYAIDWSREVNTTDPKYYKWTQWIFLKLYEKGLAELKEEPVWWCDDLKTILANEEVIKDNDGNLVAERDGKSKVERRLLKQWVLKMPQYADKLIEGLDTVDFPDSVKNAQINWIGRSEGAEVDFAVVDTGDNIRIFTTRLDTIFGATCLILAPEHDLVQKLVTADQNEEVAAYIEETKQKTEIERMAAEKKKTGVFTGAYAMNPFTKKQIPVWISDFVLTSYGTGAIMAVPAHDERDYEFAKKYNIDIVKVIDHADEFNTEKGILINSGEYNGFTSKEAFEKMITKAEKEGFGERKVHYKLRDWLFSRQRYWGEPIPLIHKKNGVVEAIVKTDDEKGVKEKLPLLLPEVPDYTPSSDATSPLSKNEDWVNTIDSEGNPAKRETNTMPNWAGSCWYYLRYIDPNNDSAFADMEKMKYWLPVDRYFGGSEHTTLHLLYSRFWHKFLYDQGLVPTAEPYAWRMNGGILLGPDGEKMSKSRGNVINPDDVMEKYGVDALRLYVCFMGPYDATIVWNENGVRACRNFLDMVYATREKVTIDMLENKKLEVAYNKMVKNVTRMIDELKMNTAVSEFMIFMNEVKKSEKISKNIWVGFLKLLAPFTPFIAEELWHEIGETDSIHLAQWPQYDEALTQDDVMTIAIQINGKIRGEFEIDADANEESIKQKALDYENTQKWLNNRIPQKVIYVKGKLISIVV